jgi:hypothetical protein
MITLNIASPLGTVDPSGLGVALVKRGDCVVGD